MTINVLSVIIGVLVGVLLMGLVVWFTMPSLMLIKRRSTCDYEGALTTLSEMLEKKQDWQLLKVNDYQERTAAFAKLERVCSLSVCNPRYSAKILTDEANRGVTAFMPLAIGVYEDKKRQVFISQLNIKLLGMMFGGTIAEMMKMAGTDLNEVVDAAINK
jgi:uncharacterized protein (DUF302 family)